jgi:hypothetical protein
VIGSGQSAMLAGLLPEDELADANAVPQTVREGLRLVARLAGAALFTAFGGAAAPGLAAGARHVRDTIPWRDMTIACAAALLFIGFSETLTFEVVDVGLDRDAAFVGVLLAVPGSAPSAARPSPPLSYAAPAKVRRPASG